MRCFFLLVIITASASTPSISDSLKFFKFPLSAGLPQSLAPLADNRDMLFLIIHKPKQKMNLNSLASILEVLAKYRGESQFFGHVQLAWSCQLNGKLHQSALGFTSDIDNKIKEKILQGHGLNSFLIADKEFRLESPAEIEFSIQQSKLEKRVEIISVAPRGKCQEVLKKVWSFINDKNKAFTLVQSKTDRNPSEHNCSSSVVSFLSPLDRIHAKLLQSKTEVEVPILKKHIQFFDPYLMAEVLQ